MSFDSQVVELSSADLDRLFDSTPEGTPSADTLSLGKESTEVHVTKSDNGVDVFDDSMLAADEKEVKETPEVTSEENISEEIPEEAADDNEEGSVTDTSVNGVLKNTVDYLISQGLWSDFEGREDLEITQETYAELAARQAQNSAYDILDELVKPYIIASLDTGADDGDQYIILDREKIKKLL